MTPERWRQVTAVFHDALARDVPARAAFLERACAGDSEVRTEVERLLAAHQVAGEFGEVPVVPGSADAPTRGTENPRGLDADGEPQARPRSPFIWVVVFAAALTVLVFSSTGWFLFLQGGATLSLGWNEGRRGPAFFVQRVDPDGPAAGILEAGDRVLSVNGMVPLVPGGTQPHRSELSPGDTYRVAVEREGKQIEATLSATEGPNILPRRVSYFVFSFIWCLVGLFIGFARPDRPAARLSFGAALTTGLGYSQGALARPMFSFNPLHMVLGLHFFARFPADRPLTRTWKWVLTLLYCAAAIPLALQFWRRIVRQTQGLPAVVELVTSHQFLFAFGPPLPLYVFYTCLVGIVVTVVRNYRALSGENDRRRIRWVAYGSIASLTPQIIWSAAELVVGGPAMSWMALPADVATVGVPLSVAYAVVKHEVFDIKVVVRRGLRYLLARRFLQAAVALPALALAYTVFQHRNLTLVALVTETSAYLYWLAAAGVMLRFRQPIASWLDRRFFREEYDKDQLVLGLLEDLRKAESVSELARLTSDKLSSALHPSAVYVWYRDFDELPASESDPLLTPPDFPSGGRWLAWLERHGAATPLPKAEEGGLSREEIRWFSRRGISLIVPMMDASDRLVGVLALGQKKSEELYSDGDRRLLNAIAKQAADVREVLRLRARVNDEVRVRHDVLARLDGQVDVLKECPACGACFDGAVETCEHDGRGLRLSLPVSRTIDGKYRLNRLIGKGGMGAVYEAHDVRLERTVAVKIMLSRALGEQTALRRFHREARAAAHLAHPNIVSVFDFGPLQGEGAYLVMEMVRGSTLRAELDRARRIPPAAAAEWFGPLLDGAAAAHAHGIIHRDLKPENVIGRRDEKGALSVKILDLGLVKFSASAPLFTSPMTADGLVMGTPAYMSPEQLLGGDVDERTDIFAVAVMLIESLTGRRPFHGNSFRDYLIAQQQAAYRLPASSARTRELSDLVAQCLMVDRQQRVSSAATLRGELIPLLLRCEPDDFIAGT